MAAAKALRVFSTTPRLASCSPRWAIGRAINQSKARCPVSGRIGRLFDLEYRFHLYGHVDRQRASANGRARMLALVAQHLNDEIGGTVDDLGLIGKLRYSVDEAQNLHAALHAIEIARACILQLGENVDGADARGLCRFLGAEILADLSLIFEFSVFQRHLAGGEDEIARAHPTDIIGDGRCRLGQFNSELLEAGIDLGHLKHSFWSTAALSTEDEGWQSDCCVPAHTASHSSPRRKSGSSLRRLLSEAGFRLSPE